MRENRTPGSVQGALGNQRSYCDALKIHISKMVKLTVDNYRKDKYYPKVVKAMIDELIHSSYVSPIEVIQRMDLLKKDQVADWKKGRVTYLEKIISCNLSKASRILRLMHFHAHDLNLKPSITIYKRKARSRTIPLRFSKSGIQKLEESYSRHFLKMGKNAIVNINA